MKSKKLKTVAQLLIVVCLIAFASCKKFKTEKPFIITIDYIEITFDGAVPRIDREDSISIRLHGVIGPDQCHKLYGFPLLYEDQKYPNTNRYIIEVYGIYEENENGNPCTLKESILDYEMVIFPETPGTYTFYDYNKPEEELGSVVVY